MDGQAGSSRSQHRTPRCPSKRSRRVHPRHIQHLLESTSSADSVPPPALVVTRRYQGSAGPFCVPACTAESFHLPLYGSIRDKQQRHSGSGLPQSEESSCLGAHGPGFVARVRVPGHLPRADHRLPPIWLVNGGSRLCMNSLTIHGMSQEELRREARLPMTSRRVVIRSLEIRRSSSDLARIRLTKVRCSKKSL